MWWEGDNFTPCTSQTEFSERRKSLLLISPVLRSPKARHSSKLFPEDNSLIAARAPRPAINKIVLLLPLTEETPGWHQPVWNQLFLRLWSPQCWLSKLPGHLLRPRYRPRHADNPSKAHCGHCMWGGGITSQSDWLQPLLNCGRPFWFGADDNESLIEWLTTLAHLEVLMTPPHWGLHFPAGLQFVTVWPWYLQL